jgi:hypothetical protein
MMSKPIETLSVPAGKSGTLNASIWENEIEQDHKRFTTYSVTIERRYKEGEEWKSSKSFRANELLQVAYLANQAYERALQLRAQQAAASAA